MASSFVPVDMLKFDMTVNLTGNYSIMICSPLEWRAIPENERPEFSMVVGGMYVGVTAEKPPVQPAKPSRKLRLYAG